MESQKWILWAIRAILGLSTTYHLFTEVEQSLIIVLIGDHEHHPGFLAVVELYVLANDEIEEFFHDFGRDIVDGYFAIPAFREAIMGSWLNIA